MGVASATGVAAAARGQARRGDGGRAPRSPWARDLRHAAAGTRAAAAGAVRVGGPDAGARRRSVWLAFWSGLALAALAVRLVDVQLVQGRALAAAAERQRLAVVPLPATRGPIVDRLGEVLAVSVPAVDVWADQAQVGDKPAAARALAGVLDPPASAILGLLRRPGQYVMLERQATLAQGRAVRALGLTGVYVSPDAARTYPDGFFLGPVLGFVGADGRGLEGVEYSYQDALAGRNGYQVEQVAATGDPLPGPPLRDRAPQAGLTLQLTIDAGLQHDLEERLEAAVATTGARAAYGVVLKPDDGEILAMAAWPTFDPNHFADVPPTVWANTPWSTDLVPGSVFKTIVTAAALETGVVTPATPFYDPGVVTVDGVPLHNFQPLETQTTFQRAFEESANVIFARVGLRIGFTRFYDYLHAFGLFDLTGVDLPGEQHDILPPEHGATTLTLAEESFGESLAVTPLSLADAVAAIANGGLLVRPHVGLALLSADGRRVRTLSTQVVRRVLSPAVAALVRRLMVGVVNDGTGGRGFIPCYDVAGKTGTANIYANGGVSNRYIASFVGFAPADHPAALALVMLVDPKGPMNEGGEVSAPVVQAVLAAALHRLGVPPHCTPADAALPHPGAPGTTALNLDMVTMPALVNLSPSQALARARQADIELQVDGRGARLLSQNPPAGAMVQRWTTAYGYTSITGPVPGSFVAVPDVHGDTIAQAAAALSRAGLALDAVGVGRAVAQDPGPGVQAPPGSGVRVQFAGGRF